MNKEFVDNIVLNNGFYNGDSDNTLGDNPRVVKIVKYDNAWDGVAFGIITEQHDPDKYAASEFVQNPVIYWEYKP